MILRHATRASRVSWIVGDGLRPDRRALWKNALGGRISEKGRLYAWRTEIGAVLWAAKMRWEFGPAVGVVEPLIAIIEFEADATVWEPDPIPALPHPGAMRSQVGVVVPPEALRRAWLVLPADIRQAIANRTTEWKGD